MDSESEIDPSAEGLLPCGECDGTGTIVGRVAKLLVCPVCDGGGWCHPFLSFAEFATQVRERNPGAAFARPLPEDHDGD